MDLQAEICARVSTADGGQDTENQLAELRQFAASQGCHTSGEHVDHESENASERARAAPAYARQHGTRSGKPIGRPRAVFNLDQVRELRRQGVSWRKIARRVGAGVGTVRRAYQSLCDPAEASQGKPAPERVQADPDTTDGPADA